MKSRIIIFTWLLFPALIFQSTLWGQIPEIKITTSEIWGPGLWSEVKVEISGGAGLGPCRFVQSIPVGFYVQPASYSGCDMFFSNNTLNIVWSRFPSVKSFTVSYDVMPEKSISGTIELGGTLYYVVGSGNRSSVSVPPKSVLVDASGTGKAAGNPEPLKQASQPDVQPAVQTSQKSQESIVFRIQVLSSSSKLTDQELKKRLGVSFQEEVTVVRKGTLYKYMVGSYTSIEKASVLLNDLKGEGVTEAFIVAYLNGEQITLEEARSRIR